MSKLDKPVRPVPEPEVAAKAQRRRFSAEYKADILRQAEACAPGTGELGALLRREGLYSSHLSAWRAQREEGARGALRPKKRGRKPKPTTQEAQELECLRRENERLRLELEKAELIIGVQKKLSRLLGLTSEDEAEASE